MAKNPDNYFNPFPKLPLRLLWWIDDSLHAVKLCLKPLCNYLDNRIWDGTDEFFQE